jgi:hypothetical protein
MVDSREPEVLEGGLAQILKNPVQRCLRCNPSGLDA